MKPSIATAAAALLISPAGFASPFLYNFTELGFYSGERGGFAAANAGDNYAVSGLRASHAQKYQKWVAELGGNYGRNVLEIDSEDQSFTELGIEAAVGQYFPLGRSLEVAGFVGGNYLSIETLEFTSSDTYFFARARASYALSSTLDLDVDYETQSGTGNNNNVATVTATWDNRRNLSAAFRHQINLSDNDSPAENLLRLAYQSAPDLKFYLQHRSGSHETGDTAIIELGARILLGQGQLVDVDNEKEDTPQRRAEERRKSANEALRRDLPSSVR